MELEKLNKCLSEMDVLSCVMLHNKQATLEIVFNCLSGGEHENVDLVLILTDPYYYHLPFTLDGSFQLSVCSNKQLSDILPSEFCEEDLSALRIIYNGNLSNFYCCFSDISWSVTGGGSIKNSHELL